MADEHSLTWPPAVSATTAPPAYADEQTQALIARCLKGDESAYATLYEQHGAMIYRLTYSILQHREDAEEVLQDCFEYAFRRLHKYDANKSAFKTWLYQIAISRCRNKRRRKQLPSFSINQLVSQDITDRHTPTVDEILELNDQQKLVWETLAELSPKLRETAVLRYYKSLPYGEIGEILGIPTKTAESRMRLAHKALRKLLSEKQLG
jgi:RNA polymerase sigma-70 factor (ECF subfamily)